MAEASAAHAAIETVGCIQTIQTTTISASAASTESPNSSSRATVTSIIVVRNDSTDTADSKRTPIRQQIIRFDAHAQQRPLHPRQEPEPEEDHDDGDGIVTQLSEEDQRELESSVQSLTGVPQTVVVEGAVRGVHLDDKEDAAAIVEQHGVDILEDAIETSAVGATSVMVETGSCSGSAGPTFDDFDALGLAAAAAVAAATSSGVTTDSSRGADDAGCSTETGAGGNKSSGGVDATIAAGTSASASSSSAAAAAIEINQDAMMMFTVPADDWKAHMTRKEREFVCRLCPYIAQYQHHYVGHFYTHHATTKPHQCGLCFKTFPLASTLKRHVATVHVAAKFACEICGKVFPRRDSFNFHVKTHLSRQTDTN